MYEILDRVNFPEDIKNFSNSELILLSKDIRKFLITTLSNTGGHLGPNLGVVELTLALHKVFNSPKDKIIWDIGHQSYIHKILTGRKNLFSRLRQNNGISGFTKRSESEFDHFGAGHSSTSISAGLGIAIAKKFLNQDNNIISVIGDASIVSGMAFEGLNHAGSLNVTNFTVILNDNNKSILDSVGALNSYFLKLTSSYTYSYIRKHSKAFLDNIPFNLGKVVKDVEKYLRNLNTNGFFEALGFFYIGPIDGHNFDQLLPVLTNIYLNKHKSKPILLHVITKKGKGYKPAEVAYDNYHGIGKFCIESGKILEKISKNSYSEIFSKEIEHLAQIDKSICAISAGTISGVGLINFSKVYKERTFDVGIAEQHAVTFAAGLAVENFKPYVCLYSTFAQRAYDQIIHDVCLQNLPVKFILDRTGFVGSDGATHHGLLNYTMYLPLPNIIYMVPFTVEELVSMVTLSSYINDAPVFISFPKGDALFKQEVTNMLNFRNNNLTSISENKYCKNDSSFLITEDNLSKSVSYNSTGNSKDKFNYKLLNINGLEFAKGKILQQGKQLAVISMGSLLKEILIANQKLLDENINITIFNARFLKPLDSESLKTIIMNHNTILTFEEGYSGGFFIEVYNFYQKHRELNTNLKLIGNWVEDKYFEQAKYDEQLKQTNLDSISIYKKIKEFLL